MSRKHSKHLEEFFARQKRFFELFPNASEYMGNYNSAIVMYYTTKIIEIKGIVKSVLGSMTIYLCVAEPLLGIY